MHGEFDTAKGFRCGEFVFLLNKVSLIYAGCQCRVAPAARQAQRMFPSGYLTVVPRRCYLPDKNSEPVEALL